MLSCCTFFFFSFFFSFFCPSHKWRPQNTLSRVKSIRCIIQGCSRRFNHKKCKCPHWVSHTVSLAALHTHPHTCSIDMERAGEGGKHHISSPAVNVTYGDFPRASTCSLTVNQLAQQQPQQPAPRLPLTINSSPLQGRKSHANQSFPNEKGMNLIKKRSHTEVHTQTLMALSNVLRLASDPWRRRKEA